MKEEVNESLLKDADELLNRPDREIMALAMNKNDRWAENYLTATIIKLRGSIKKLEKSTNISSCVMILLTIILVVLTYFLAKKT